MGSGNGGLKEKTQTWGPIVALVTALAAPLSIWIEGRNARMDAELEQKRTVEAAYQALADQVDDLWEAQQTTASHVEFMRDLVIGTILAPAAGSSGIAFSSDEEPIEMPEPAAAAAAPVPALKPMPKTPKRTMPSTVQAAKAAYDPEPELE